MYRRESHGLPLVTFLGRGELTFVLSCTGEVDRGSGLREVPNARHRVPYSQRGIPSVAIVLNRMAPGLRRTSCEVRTRGESGFPYFLQRTSRARSRWSRTLSDASAFGVWTKRSM